MKGNAVQWTSLGGLAFTFGVSLFSTVNFASDEAANNSDFECCYVVTGVSQDDVLNVRAERGSLDTLVGTIPYNAVGVRVAQCDGKWCSVLYGNIQGWVNSKYLRRQ